jgi:TonB family protein
VSPPELIPPATRLTTPEHCKGKIKGRVRLSVIVDAQGAPRNINFLEPLGNDLDKLALLTMDNDRFKPATQDGNPVATAQIVTMELNACESESTGEGEKNAIALHLRSLPEQHFSPLADIPKHVILGPTVAQNLAKQYNEHHFDKVGQYKNGTIISAPKLIRYTEAQYTLQARKESVSGICLVSLIVDTNGMPQKIRVVRPIGYGLDENAIEAVSHYRFQPALADGFPVAVPIQVQVNFKLLIPLPPA